ncbi:hypothetical protein IV203_021909 [Nitzschia inconspicua]|uniref:Uncharacterized protein n=1 Tax=Nitzschia inconspicua TaxID=303405 RepID=A0A9K3PEK4_9STRA|nr:hypothetical protein IV203_021909 [Nitzschia inconspicua]
MHLGHHKAIIKPFPIPENYDCEDPDKPPPCEDLRNDLVQGQLQLINYAIKHSYCYTRWTKVATFIIQKEPGNTKFGGLPGRDATTPVFLEELQWEILRASRKSLLRMDFDATSCYDRIIPNITSLAGRSFGQHRTLCFLHANFLEEAQYILKTKLGLSNSTRILGLARAAQIAQSSGCSSPADCSMPTPPKPTARIPIPGWID